MINELLSWFKDDTIEEIIAKIVMTDCFIPNLGKDEDNISIMGLFGLQVYDVSGNVKKFDKTPQIKNEKGATDIRMKWQKYSVNHSMYILLFQQLIKKFDSVELMNKIFAPIFSSKVMNEVTKKLIRITLSSFFNEFFFPSMQSSIFQIESVLRNICLKYEKETRSIGTEKERQKSMGSLIQILRENKIVKEKILVFIEWFLSNESNQISKNYRNDIAHGLDSMEQFNGIYTKENALSLILIYLSLSKYGFN
jgi:hypothetical protein